MQPDLNKMFFVNPVWKQAAHGPYETQVGAYTVSVFQRPFGWVFILRAHMFMMTTSGTYTTVELAQKAGVQAARIAWANESGAGRTSQSKEPPQAHPDAPV